MSLRISVDCGLVKEVCEFARHQLDLQIDSGDTNPAQKTELDRDRKILLGIQRAGHATHAYLIIQGEDQYIFSYWVEKYGDYNDARRTEQRERIKGTG